MSEQSSQLQSDPRRHLKLRLMKSHSLLDKHNRPHLTSPEQKCTDPATNGFKTTFLRLYYGGCKTENYCDPTFICSLKYRHQYFIPCLLLSTRFCLDLLCGLSTFFPLLTAFFLRGTVLTGLTWLGLGL